METRYSYFWMPKQSGERDAYVLSIARQFDKPNSRVKFGWALNVPPRWSFFEEKAVRGERLIPGDHFSRKTGRRIAVERLEKETNWFDVKEYELPIEVCLDKVASGWINDDKDFPAMAQEIAELELDRRNMLKPNVYNTSILDKFMNLFR